jgi:hypothetical protein
MDTLVYRQNSRIGLKKFQNETFYPKSTRKLDSRLQKENILGSLQILGGKKKPSFLPYLIHNHLPGCRNPQTCEFMKRNDCLTETKSPPPPPPLSSSSSNTKKRNRKKKPQS